MRTTSASAGGRKRAGSQEDSCRTAATDQVERQAKRRQLSNPFISQAGCAVCAETGLQLVQLGACGHGVCRGCMTSALLHALKLKQQLPLRCPLPHCRARLAMQPALQLLQQQVPAGGALAAKVLLAAAAELAPLVPGASGLLCACPHADCQVPLELPPDPLPDVPVECPSCLRALCSNCKSKWHSGLRCEQYQALLASRRTRQQQQLQQQQHAAYHRQQPCAGSAGPLAPHQPHQPQLWHQAQQAAAAAAAAAGGSGALFADHHHLQRSASPPASCADVCRLGGAVDSLRLTATAAPAPGGAARAHTGGGERACSAFGGGCWAQAGAAAAMAGSDPVSGMAAGDGMAWSPHKA